MTRFSPDHTAIVTGGTQGLGLEVARQLVQGGVGHVAVVGRNEERGVSAAEELNQMGAEAMFVRADLSEVAAPAAIIDATTERFGPIHVLVNAAAKTDRDSVWQSSPEVFDAIMATNVRAPYLLIQLAADLMKEHGIEGSIVNVGSVAGHGGPPFISSYSASKGALIALTKNLANALSEERIRVNIVNPGWMDTPAEDMIQRRYHAAGDDWREAGGRAMPFGRLLNTEEVARQIVFLASPSSGIMTGAVIDFDQRVWTGGPQPGPGNIAAETP